jgi:hypothetical protein
MDSSFIVHHSPFERSVFVPDDSFLVGDGDGDGSIGVKDDALAGEAAFEAGVDGSVNEIFLFVGDFFDVLLAFFHIDVASGAGAHAAAVVVEVHVVVFRDFEDGHFLKIARHRFGGDARVFKLKYYRGHDFWQFFAKKRAKVAL